MPDSDTNRVKDPDPNQTAVTHGNPQPKFDWPPPVQLAALVAAALALGLLLAGYDEAAVAALIVAIVLQTMAIAQYRALMNEFHRRLDSSWKDR